MSASSQPPTQPGLETRSLADRAGIVWVRVVVGSGISGLNAARLLRERGDSALLLEKESGSSELVRCKREASYVLHHRIGAHTGRCFWWRAAAAISRSRDLAQHTGAHDRG